MSSLENGRARTWRARLSNFTRAAQEYYARPYRQALLEDRRDEEDFLLLAVLGEVLGVPDPAAYYTAELLPFVYDDFHAWHQRIGLKRSPLDHVACC